MTYIERLRGRARRWAGPLAGLTAASLLLGLAGPVAPAAADAADLTDGLALWYKLDASSGTKAVDASGNGRDGTVNGTAALDGQRPGPRLQRFGHLHQGAERRHEGHGLDQRVHGRADGRVAGGPVLHLRLRQHHQRHGQRLPLCHRQLPAHGHRFGQLVDRAEHPARRLAQPEPLGVEAAHLHPDRQHGRAVRGRRGGRPQHVGHHHPGLHRFGHHDRQLRGQVGLHQRQALQGQDP